MFSRKIMWVIVLALLVLGTGSYATASGTTTLTLTGTGGVSQNGIYVYPYDFSIATTGKATLTNVPLLCDDFTDSIFTTESWTVNVATGSSAIVAQGQMAPVAAGQGMFQTGAGLWGNVSITKTQAYQDAAYLYLLLGTGGNSSQDEAINETIWAIFASATTGTYTTAEINNGAPTGYASWFAYAQTNSTSASLNLVDLYSPTPDGAGAVTHCPSGDTCGRPQEFFGKVPEPGSFELLGIGLIGLGIINRRRIFAGLLG